jgi:type VI secretion system secreted protein VgrG
MVSQSMTMDSTLGPDALPVALRMTEAFSTISELLIDFLHPDPTVDLGSILGTSVGIRIHRSEGEDKEFTGHVVAAEALGTHDGNALYTIEVRPWLWFLSRTQEIRIFQDKTALEIIKEVISEYGFSGMITDSTTDSFPTRTICVQYRETDLDFVSRLMHEEGIYYFFEHKGTKTTLVLADSPSAHSPVPAKLPLDYKDLSTTIQSDHVYSWQELDFTPSGRVMLQDFDFEKPKADLASIKALPKGQHKFNDREIYDYPGGYADTAEGDRYARIRAESEALQNKTYVGAGNVATLTCGGTLSIDRHGRTKKGEAFVITSLEHTAIVARKFDPTSGSRLAEGRRITREAGAPDGDHVDVQFRAIPKDTPYRTHAAPPRPLIPGVQTAIVVGPKGEEIHTDKYGRIRIQFHWDRLGKSDQNATCWVRHMTPWSGKNWGMIHIPRVGQEVVVQFEDGNPDRPLVIGMLYNADTMPPYALDANKSQSGIKTNSYKGGGGFNELMFEDKKDAELVRLQAEKDFEQIIKNDATITVGLEKKDKGDMTTTVHRHMTETVKTGDHILEVETGSQFQTIKTDQVEKIKGKRTQEVDKDVSVTVKQGNLSTVVNMGNETRQLKQGNYSLKTAMGKISQEAMQEIELKVGANSIKIDQSGVTIKGIMVKIEGTAKLEAKAPMSQVKGDGLLILKGGVTMIN